MNLFRDNLFLVLTLGLTVVLSGLLLFLGMGAAGQIEDEQVASREDLADSLQSLARGQLVNQLIINAEKRRVEIVLETLQDVRQSNLEYNSRNFKIPELQLLGGEKQPALPYDETTWNRNELAFRFVRQYHLQLDAMRQKLQATTIPTTEEIESEAVDQQRRLEREQRIQEMWNRSSSGQPTGRTRTDPGMGDPGMMGPAGPAGMTGPARRTTGRTGTVNTTEQARTLAIRTLQQRRARAGLIYVSELSFDVMFAAGGIVSRLEPEKIWDAQLGLWVQQDIIDVIARTNREVLQSQNVPEDERSVLTAPIKRLLQIDVQSSIPQEGSAARSTAGRAGGAFGGPPGGFEGPDMRRGSFNRSAGQQPQRPETLTGYQANPTFDVVNYTFTVLMPTRYLPELEKNLLEQNYHLIINEQITANARAEAPNARGSQNVEDLYYYGTEPVSQVTIEGQLLLVTGFTRGLWQEPSPRRPAGRSGEQAGRWQRLPLMPLEVLQQLPPAALRPQDKNLLQAVQRLRAGQPVSPEMPRPTWLSDLPEPSSPTGRF